MPTLDEVLTRLEELVSAVETLDDPVRERVFELLDGIDTIHRLAIHRLAERLGPDRVADLWSDPYIAWLFDAYGVAPAPSSVAVAPPTRRR